MGRGDPLETRYFSAYVITPVALRQTVWAQVGVPTIVGKAGAQSLEMGRS